MAKRKLSPGQCACTKPSKGRPSMKYCKQKNGKVRFKGKCRK